jgi:hypothetical protein
MTDQKQYPIFDLITKIEVLEKRRDSQCKELGLLPPWKFDKLRMNWYERGFNISPEFSMLGETLGQLPCKACGEIYHIETFILRPKYHRKSYGFCTRCGCAELLENIEE